MAANEFALELLDVRKSFGKTEIIRGAQLQVRPGELVDVRFETRPEREG